MFNFRPPHIQQAEGHPFPLLALARQNVYRRPDPVFIQGSQRILEHISTMPIDPVDAFHALTIVLEPHGNPARGQDEWLQGTPAISAIKKEAAAMLNDMVRMGALSKDFAGYARRILRDFGYAEKPVAPTELEKINALYRNGARAQAATTPIC